MSVLFPDLYQSAMGKAVKVSPVIDGVTIGPSAPSMSAVTIIHELKDETLPSGSTSTPKRLPKIQKIPLSSLNLRRPRHGVAGGAPVVEIKSEEAAIKKTLMSEIAKERLLAVKKNIMKREEEAARKQQENLEELFRQAELISRQKELQKIAAMEQSLSDNRKLLINVSEEDNLAATKALERSEKVRQTLEDAKRKSAAEQKKVKLYEKLSQWTRSYGIQYKAVNDIIKSTQDQQLYDKIVPLVKKVCNDLPFYETLIDKAKNEKLVPQDMVQADALLVNINKVLEDLKNEADKFREVQEGEKRRLEEEKKEELARKEAAERENSKKEESQSPGGLSEYFDLDSVKRYTDLRERLTETHNQLVPLVSDPNYKTFRFDLQKAVTTPVNAISPVSGPHMMNKFKILYGLLSGQPVPGSQVQHPQSSLLAKEILAKLFVRQGDLTVSSKPEAAFAFASIIVNLWVDFPDFGDLLMANFHRVCPYLAPVFLPQLEGMSDLDYYKSLGYHVTNGEIEKQDMFLKRMKGIMRLYAAILVSSPRSPKPHPLGLAEAWRWLAAILNIYPKSDICAELIHEMLVVAGHDMLVVYRKKFKQMLAYICQEYFPLLKKATVTGSGGPLTRLELFLQKTLKEGSIPPPTGRIEPSFWFQSNTN